MKLVVLPEFKSYVNVESLIFKFLIFYQYYYFFNCLSDVAYKVLNKCMTTNDFGMRTENYQVEFNYELIDDKFAPWNGSTRTMGSRGHHRKENNDNKSAAMLISTMMKDVEAHEITEEAIKTKFQQIHPLSVMVK